MFRFYLQIEKNEYIIVLGDYCTKWKEAFAVQNYYPITVAATQVFSKLACLEQIHTDQGRKFVSYLVLYLTSGAGIQKTRTNPYRPQSNGLVEKRSRALFQICVNENYHC